VSSRSRSWPAQLARLAAEWDLRLHAIKHLAESAAVTPIATETDAETEVAGEVASEADAEA
jgi:hypothetical protein